MLIQVDVDSTLYDADKLFAEVAKEAGIKWPRKAAGWLPPSAIAKEDGSVCTPIEMKNLFKKCHSREYVMQQKAYPDASVVLARIAEQLDGAEIAYVSDRNEQQTSALRDWLEAQKFLFSDDQFVAATKDKRHWMRERRPDVVIDDRVRTMLMARYELGAQVVSLEHPHNVNLRGEAEGIYICKDWSEIDAVLWSEIFPKIAPVSRENEVLYGRK